MTMVGDKADESAFSLVAKTYGAEHTLVRISAEALATAVDDATLHMGQPLPSAAALVQHCLFKAISPDIRVALSGAGGDESWVGAPCPRSRAASGAHAPGPPPWATKSMSRRLAKRAGMSDLAGRKPSSDWNGKLGSRIFSAEERVDLLRDPAMASRDSCGGARAVLRGGLIRHQRDSARLAAGMAR